MKNTLKIDLEHCQIIMDRTFAKKVRDTRSDEYKHLQRVRSDYPEFEVTERKIKRNSGKKTYKGLTYWYMEQYICTHEQGDARAAVLNEFYEKRLISQCHGEGYRYPIIKQWFLKRYPEIAEFGIETDDQPEKVDELPQSETAA